MTYRDADGHGIQAVVVSHFDGTDVVDGSSNANGSFSVTLPAVAGKTNYVTGIIISGSGATAAAAKYAVLSGVGPYDMYLHLTVPAGVADSSVVLNLQFAKPLPATAANQAISLLVPAFGAGNTLESAIIWGFYR